MVKQQSSSITLVDMLLSCKHIARTSYLSVIYNPNPNKMYNVYVPTGFVTCHYRYGLSSVYLIMFFFFTPDLTASCSLAQNLRAQKWSETIISIPPPSPPQKKTNSFSAQMKRHLAPLKTKRPAKSWKAGSLLAHAAISS